MKTIKSMLFIATLMAVAVSTASAQQDVQFSVAKGDTVMINPDCETYLTGEKMSKWVYSYKHVVYQLGTKRFPTGVLLYNGAKIGILSWVDPDCLNVVVSKKQQDGGSTTPSTSDGGNQGTDVTSGEGSGGQTQGGSTSPDIQQGGDTTNVTSGEGQGGEGQGGQSQGGDVTSGGGQSTDTTNVAQGGDEGAGAKKRATSSYDRFTIGLRGGASALMHQANQGNWTCGGDAVLDLQYAHYWTKEGRPVDLGLIVGLGVGYHQSGLEKDADHTEFDRTAGTSNVHYTVDVNDVKETDHQLQLEVPLMFSLIHEKGLFFNIGPKFMIPVYTPYKQTVDQNNTHISAYFQETGVTVVDQTLTGVYTGQQPEEKNGIQFNVNVMLTAEIGYEWILKSGNSLGLGAYANYSVFNTYKNATNTEGLFNLTAPTDASVAKLDVLSATHAYADKLGYFDAGIKLAYHFNFPKKAKKVVAE